MKRKEKKMQIYYFVDPGMAYEKRVYILAQSEDEAIKIFCRKYNETPQYARKLLKRVINKPGVIYEYAD